MWSSRQAFRGSLVLTTLAAATTTLLIFDDVAVGRAPPWFVLLGLLTLSGTIIAVHRVLRWEDYAVDHDIQFAPGLDPKYEARLEALEAGRIPKAPRKKAPWK